jgi:hypothetical protein
MAGPSDTSGSPWPIGHPLPCTPGSSLTFVEVEMAVDVGVGAEFLFAKHARINCFSIDVSRFADCRTVDARLHDGQPEQRWKFTFMQGRMERGMHGLPKVSPAKRCYSMPCRMGRPQGGGPVAVLLSSCKLHAIRPCFSDVE